MCVIAEKLIGNKCLFDEECYGMNTVCRNGRCTCPTNFEEFDIDERTTICRLACPTGQQLYGVECTRVAHYGQMCEKDSQCVDPFNACVSGTCQCAPGTTRDVMRGFCYAVCPDGMHPRQTCRRLFVNDVDMLENAANTDSCPLGYRCVTYGSPYVGHCCRLRCPYGEPDLSQSCDAGSSPESKCRPLTHFCYSISEPGRLEFYFSCRISTFQYNDDRFPTCEKSCNQLDEIPSSDRCLQKAQLGQRCLSKKQCPNFSDCRFGTCQCLCGYKQVRDNILGTRCTNPDDPLSLNTILTGVEQLFGNKRATRN
ncbi:EB module [Ancylostoma duodenale]|uniref:EB module n=1 Tax=Ancylostoma duodenale TaxID=51022 RepID=A0A0C2HDQ4_9BILA|nr:EB module [Ancylostoma duodenale]